MKRGDRFKRKLPPWVCNGEEVIITTTEVLKNKFGLSNFNGYDFRGEYEDSKGDKHEGLFYLKDCSEVK